MVAGAKIWDGAAWQDAVGSGGPGGSPPALLDQYSGALLSDQVDTGTSARLAVTCTGSATPHTLGTYAPVDLSLSAAASGIFLSATGISTSALDSSTLLVIATGASGSEVVWATVPIGYTSGGAFTQVFVPGFIASGTRVVVGARAAQASQAVSVVCSFMPVKASVAPLAPKTYGIDTATSRGTVLTNPGSLNTKGAWTPITTSTTADHDLVLVRIQGGGSTNVNGSGVLVDIGIGGSGSESVLIPDVYFLGNTSEFYTPRSPTTFGVHIPSGSRLSARFARANANHTIDVALVAA